MQNDSTSISNANKTSADALAKFNLLTTHQQHIITALADELLGNVSTPCPTPESMKCTANLYGFDAPHDITATIALHPDHDGQGLYVRIRDAADATPMIGLDLTIEQATALRDGLSVALMDARDTRLKLIVGDSEEVQP